MKTILKSTALGVLMSVAVACGEGNKEKAGALNDKKAELTRLKSEQAKRNESIKKLEDEIAKLDTAAAKTQVAKLVNTAPIVVTDFSHYIDLQGHVDAENISYISPRNQGGQIKAIYISKGQTVKKGQLILKIDDRLYLEQIETLKTQLNFAKDIYQRRQNLWKQNIGSEVELLSAKNNVDQLDRQIAIAKESWSMTNVYSDVSGFVDELNVRVGEMFTGAGAMGPQIRIVNASALKVVADIPENYLASVGKGSKVVIGVPDINRTYNSVISFTSASINPNSRGFTVEAKLPFDGQLKPNMLTTVRILDYSAPNAVTVPVNVVQTDEAGKYVYIASTENGKTVARKKQIVVGQVYGNNAEVKGGLTGTELLITQGYQTLYDGQAVAVSQ
ncbi:MAG: efflux RND transporter periplasmic adaptor subunit [Bacteroidetes bacterium]|nr:MAG: efflux RND transporter periplasmic adaptor subunit [Bacteroidota bacterium]